MATIDLQGKIALVTGAGAGIGRAIAIALANSGAYVVVNYRKDEEGARDTLTQIEQGGGHGHLFAADVARATEVALLFEEIATRLGGLNILVNNAGGLVQRCKIAEMSEELWDEVININLKSTFLCCKAALPLMKGRERGRIINMASLAALDGGGQGAAHYAASKGAVATFTRGLAKEAAADGITVNSLAPGLINTAFHDVFTAPAARQNMIKNTPLAREGLPLDVANATLFLVSDLADFITGETLNVNGGQRMS